MKIPRRIHNAAVEERSGSVFIRPDTVQAVPSLSRTKHFKMEVFPGILRIIFPVHPKLR